MAPIWLPNAFSAAYCFAAGHKLGLHCVNMFLNPAMSGFQKITLSWRCEQFYLLRDYTNIDFNNNTTKFKACSVDILLTVVSPSRLTAKAGEGDDSLDTAMQNALKERRG